MKSQPCNSSRSVSSRRVLIVDSNSDSSESLAVLLRFHGHEVVTARTGSDTLAITRSFCPDMVILSILLGDMSGYEVARQIRSEMNDHAPVLAAMTGFAQEADRQLALDSGFDVHLVKPADPNEVLSLLETQRPRQS